MDARARIPPGLPHADPTTSYWQSTPSPIANLRTTTTLPAKADYVIIGSGISGASTALHLLARKPGSRIVMLEARTACSGATGRNGGHLKAASYRTFATHAAHLGAAEAVRIARCEWDTVAATRALVAQHGIACDLWHGRTVDVFYDAAQWLAARRATRAMTAACEAAELREGSVETYTLHTAKEAEEMYMAPGALGAVGYAAGSVSAYKLVTGILGLALEQGLNLQTETPATAVLEAPAGQGGWAVQTPRGTVVAPHVVLATNAYTAHLEPAFQSIIVPLRGHCTAQRPGSGLPRPTLPTSYSYFYASGYEYMIPRPAGSSGEGDIIIGGGRTAALPDDGVDEFGETDDSTIIPVLRQYLSDCTARYFGADIDAKGEKVGLGGYWGHDDAAGREKQAWTGIMGTSADGRPYVGAVPGKKGVWVSASFNGHGMVMCYKAAEGLADLITKGEAPEWFPTSWLMHEKRYESTFAGRMNERPPPEALGVDSESTDGPAEVMDPCS